MPALSPRSLATACRIIHARAAEDLILPPLIRDAADPTPPHRRIEAAGADFVLDFRVVYDNLTASPTGRHDTPPLRFEISATTDPDGAPVALSDAERWDLIRAFLLGVRDPIAITAPAEGGDWRIGLRIAPRFVMASAEPVRLGAGLSMDEICERLAARLLETTETFFESRAAGLAVWEARLREELFAESPRPAHEIWPMAAPAGATPHAPPARVARVEPHLSRIARRRGVAAAIALLGFAALAGAMASRGRVADARLASRHADVSMAAPETAAPQERPRVHPPAIRVALLEQRPASPLESDEIRFAALAPTVTLAAYMPVSYTHLTLPTN